MKTTIQVSQLALVLLKKLKEETGSDSYDETIKKMAAQRTNKKSMGGYFKKYFKNMSTKEVLKDLRDENDRY
jgi:hypothetical protein